MLHPGLVCVLAATFKLLKDVVFAVHVIITVMMQLTGEFVDK